METTTSSLAELEAFAQQYRTTLMAHPMHATVIGLKGDLGSGKTAFTQALARALGITEVVTSPTFVIEKRYRIVGDEYFNELIHIDAYRLKSADELRRLRWDETLRDPKRLILLEWPERVEGILPPDAPILSCSFIDEGTRRIADILSP